MDNMERTVIFDVDGTLVNTRMGIMHTIQEVLSERHLDFDGDYDLWIGPPIKDSFMSYCGMSDQEAEEATIAYRKIYLDKFIKESFLYPGMLETLDELENRGVKLAVATMKTRPQVEKLFSVLGISYYFQDIRTAREDGLLSKTQMISEIMKADEAYMIGDTNGDWKAATEAGCQFIGVTYGFGFKSGERYDFLSIDQPEEIAKIILA